MIGKSHQSTVAADMASARCETFASIRRGRSLLAVFGSLALTEFAKYAYRYLAEVQFRFKRRYDLRAILASLLTALVRAPRCPECGIRVAELHR